jgi:IMP dehydrogenase/GMP reductase
LRICFNRKNKLIAAIFKTKAVLRLLFTNYKRAMSDRERMNNAQQTPQFRVFVEENPLFDQTISKKKNKKKTRRMKNNEIVVEGIVEESMEGLEIGNDECGNEIEEEDDGEHLGNNGLDEKELEMFKAKLMKVLEDHGFDQERSSKMHWSRFLELLQIMNENDIYFK